MSNDKTPAPSEQAPDAIALLKADHRKVEDLFARFEKASAANRKFANPSGVIVDAF